MPRPSGAPLGAWTGRPLAALRGGSAPPAVRHREPEELRWYRSPDCVRRGCNSSPRDALGTVHVRVLEPDVPLSGPRTLIDVGPRPRITVEDPATVSNGVLFGAGPGGPLKTLACAAALLSESFSVLHTSVLIRPRCCNTLGSDDGLCGSPANPRTRPVGELVSARVAPVAATCGPRGRYIPYTGRGATWSASNVEGGVDSNS